MSRGDIRAALKAGLVANVAGVSDVYDYAPTSLGTASPVVMLEVEGASRRRGDFRGASIVTHRMNLHVFVALSAAGYTEDDSQDTLDTLVEAIEDYVSRNTVGAAWKSLEFAGDSRADMVAIEGGVRRHEVIPLDIREF